MKTRKGFKRFYFDDGTHEDVPISDQEPEPGEFASYYRWGDDPLEPVKGKSTGDDLHDWIRYQDNAIQWERNQRGLDELVHRRSASSAGNESAKTRSKRADMLRKIWMEIAKPLRKRNPDIEISDIANIIIDHIKEIDSEFDFNPHRSKKTISNYLSENL